MGGGVISRAVRVVVFSERAGGAKEWRLNQTYMMWISIAGVIAAMVVAFLVYVLLLAYQDMATAQRLRHDLAVTMRTQASNRSLRQQLATARAGDQRILVQVQAASTDLRHVAGLLHINVGSSNLPGLLAGLASVEKSLPVVLTAAQQRDEYLAHKPDTLPVSGPITSYFGWRPNPFTGTGSEFHPGVDIAVPIGTPVRAVAAGTVVYAGWRAGGYGYYVKVNDGYDIETYFAHNSKVLVHVGERVTRGQVLALSGSTGRSTGPHVYFGIDFHGVPVNPLPFIHSNPVAVN